MKAENVVGLFGFFFVVAPNKDPNKSLFFDKSPENQRLLFTYLISAQSFQELSSICLSALLTSSSLQEAFQVSFFQDRFISLHYCVQILKLSTGIHNFYEFLPVLCF